MIVFQGESLAVAVIAVTAAFALAGGGRYVGKKIETERRLVEGLDVTKDRNRGVDTAAQVRMQYTQVGWAEACEKKLRTVNGT